MWLVFCRPILFFALGDMSADSQGEWSPLLLNDAPGLLGEAAPAEATLSGATRRAWTCMARPSGCSGDGGGGGTHTERQRPKVFAVKCNSRDLKGVVM